MKHLSGKIVKFLEEFDNKQAWVIMYVSRKIDGQIWSGNK